MSCSLAFGQIELFKSNSKRQAPSNEFEYSSLTIDEDALRSIVKSKHQHLEIAIPYLDDQYILSLERFDLLTDGFILSDSDGKTYDYNGGLYYRGTLQDGGMVAFSVFKDDIISIMATQDGKDLNLGKPKTGAKNEYVIYNANQVANPDPMECHAESLPSYASQLAQINENLDAMRMNDCINVYVEGDYDLLVNKGGVTQAADYLTGLWNPVSTIYWNDGLEVNISQIFIWTSQDPYSTSNAGTALDDFRAENPSFNGDLAHLMALGGSGLGGVAWLDVLCLPNWSYAYSNISQWYSNFPSYSWSVNVVSHEMGHNVGSPHTHNCSWSGGAIDDCESPEGSCSPGPTPTNGGTIMSYCHTTSTGINFNNGFGPLPSALINQKVNSAGCLGGCTFAGNPPMADFTWTVYNQCASDPAGVQFFDDSTENPSSYLWTFPGGDPSTSTLQNPIVNYYSSGVYGATLEVSNSNGTDVITQDNIIFISDYPDAFFQVQVIESTIYTTNLSFNGDSYDWHYGDGYAEYAYEPVYTYEEDGNYTITLDVFNDCGVDSYTYDIVIATAPQASISMTASDGCASHEVTYVSNSSSNTDNLVWTFPGGNPGTSTLDSVVVTYDTEGVYDVSLQAVNETGDDTILFLDTVVVDNIPTTTFQYTIDGGQVSFVNGSMNADSYFWDFGNGDSATSQDTTYTFTQAGFHTIGLTSMNPCGTSYHEEMIEVAIAPVALSSIDPISGCADLDVIVQSTSTNADSLIWSFDGGLPALSNEQNPTVSYNTQGIYDIQLIAINEYGQDTLEFINIVNVDDVPQANFDYAVNGGDVDFTNMTLNGNSVSWDFGDGNTSTEDSPAHTFAESGTYTVILSTDNDCGMALATQDVTVIYEPNLQVSVNSTESCLPADFTFTDMSIDAEQILWEFPGGSPETSTASNPTVSYGEPGTYDVILTASNSFGNSELILENYITVLPDPMAEFTYNIEGLDLDLLNESLADTYLWDFGNGDTSEDISLVYSFDSEGTYEVSLTAINSCGESNSSQTILAYTPPKAEFSVERTEYCVGDNIVLNDLSSDNSIERQWNITNGNITLDVPTFTLTEIGNYDAELIVFNPLYSDTLFIEDIFTVIDKPEASFELVQDGRNISIENTSLHIGEVTWDFGDGSTSNTVNADHTYENEGEYTVEMTVSNLCGISSFEQTFNNYSLPTAEFTFVDDVICQGDEITFTNLSSDNALNFSWTFEGGIPSASTERNPTIAYPSNGTYNVELVASNPAGETTSLQQQVVIVKSAPETSFDFDQDIFDFNFTNTTSDFLSVSWDFGDGNTSIEINPDHTYLDEGTYEVILEATNECGTTLSNQTVTIINLPQADFTVESANTLCAPATVQFTNTSSSNVEFLEWSFPGGNPSTSNESNPEVTYAEAGIYDVMLTASNSSGEDMIIQESIIVVNATPIAGLTFEQNATIFDFVSTSQRADNFIWTVDGVEVSNSENFSFEPLTNGTFTVVLAVENPCGQDEIMESIVVSIHPDAGFSAETREICEGESITYSASFDANESYNWSFEGGSPETSNEQSVTVLYAEPGTYGVGLSVENLAGNSNLAFEDYITVYPKATAEYSISVDEDKVTMMLEENDATSFSWSIDGNTYTDTSVEYEFESSGDYPVTLYVENDCGSTIYNENISISIESFRFETAQIVPNPADQNLVILSDAKVIENIEVLFHDITGKYVFESGFTNLDRDIDVSHLPVGIYILSLIYQDEVRTKKLIIAR